MFVGPGLKKSRNLIIFKSWYLIDFLGYGSKTPGGLTFFRWVGTYLDGGGGGGAGGNNNNNNLNNKNNNNKHGLSCAKLS